MWPLDVWGSNKDSGSNSITYLKDWKYRKAGSDKWKKGRKGAVKTQVQADLLANGEMLDPFLDCNARDVQWVGETDWEYQAEFAVPAEAAKKSIQVLEFDGLDTFATVQLNGKEILKSENMFVKHRVDVTNKVKLDAPNVVTIYFKSAVMEGRKLHDKYGSNCCFNGEAGRLQVRKAQYGWGWDWGDPVNTCGPWQPVKLVAYDTMMKDVYVNVAVKKSQAEVDVQIELAGNPREVQMKVKVTDPSGDVLPVNVVSPWGAYAASVKFSIDSPVLWYPRGTGDQPLYTFETSLYDWEGKLVQVDTKKVGLRKVEVVEEPIEGQDGTSFYFKVNGVPVYCHGSNWIPAHSMPVLLTDDDYKAWLKLAADGNQNMIRVWGGGYFEEEIFYSECDRLGILVWQDFLFACGGYPGREDFIANVEQEVEAQLRRLRNHCCFALFSGNNEDYQVAEQCGLEWNPEDNSGDWSKTSFPARTIYERVLPRLVKKLQSDVPYHPGSPWGGRGSGDSTVGDIHQWSVWGGGANYQDWHGMGGRFVSEFGMQGLPSLKSYRQFITDPSELYPQSETVEFHNKADGFREKLRHYVFDNIRVDRLDLAGWIYDTQFMQAECLTFAYRGWRRQWQGAGRRYSSGALTWQLDDCMPMASWAIVDFYRRPKLAYYAVKRESAPVCVGMHRDGGNVDVWGVSALLQDFSATLSVDIYEIQSGKKVQTLDPQEMVLKANQATEFLTVSVPNDSRYVVYSRLVVDGKLIAAAADWPQPLKLCKFPGRKISFKVSDGSIKVSTNKPVKGVELTINNRDVFLDDNGFDLFPGDDIIVKGDVKTTDDVSMQYYEM